MDEQGRLAALGRRLVLHRPDARAWAMYDWANSAMVTVIITAVFPIYYARVAAADLPEGLAAARFGYAASLGIGMIALFAPFFGALADRVRLKKKLLGLFMLLGALAVAGLFAVREGDWFLALALFVLANVGAGGSFLFYDALLPHVAREGELDRLSTTGFALGYLGGGLFLGLAMLLIGQPGWFGLPATAEPTLPTRITFLAVAVWWGIFSIPLFLRVPEPPGPAGPALPAGALTREVLGSLKKVLGDLKRHPQALKMLIAFLIYNDAISTIIRMATVYGAELGLDTQHMIGAILLVQFAGIPFTLAFGAFADRLGTKPAILASLCVYGLTTMLAWRMTTELHFWMLALMVALVQGGAQGLSRSLYASMIPQAKSAEFFGIYAVLDRFAGILGPYLFGLMIVLTGSTRAGILPIFALFLIGGLLLCTVDVERGRRDARRTQEDIERRLQHEPA